MSPLPPFIPRSNPYDAGHLESATAITDLLVERGRHEGARSPRCSCMAARAARISPDHRRLLTAALYRRAFVRPARLRPVDAACRAGGQHGPGTSSPTSSGLRVLMGVEKWLVFGRLVGVDAGAGLQRDPSRTRVQRAGGARRSR